MVGSRTWLLAALLSASVMGCAEEETVHVDLCAGPGADVARLNQATVWHVIIYGVEDGHVVLERSWDTATPPDSQFFSLAEVVPLGVPVTFFVRGYAVLQGTTELVAIGEVGPYEVTGESSVCICVSPPDQYADACRSHCQYNDGSGCVFAGSPGG